MIAAKYCPVVIDRKRIVEIIRVLELPDKVIPQHFDKGFLCVGSRIWSVASNAVAGLFEDIEI